MVGHHNLIEDLALNIPSGFATVRDCASGLFYECQAKPTWMAGVVLLPLKMEVKLVIFSPLD